MNGERASGLEDGKIVGQRQDRVLVMQMFQEMRDQDVIHAVCRELERIPAVGKPHFGTGEACQGAKAAA
jgi:hypothetical protein